MFKIRRQGKRNLVTTTWVSNCTHFTCALVKFSDYPHHGCHHPYATVQFECICDGPSQIARMRAQIKLNSGSNQRGLLGQMCLRCSHTASKSDRISNLPQCKLHSCQSSKQLQLQQTTKSTIHQLTLIHTASEFHEHEIQSLGHINEECVDTDASYLVQVSEMSNPENLPRDFVESNTQAEVIFLPCNLHDIVAVDPWRHNNGGHGVTLPLRLLRTQCQSPSLHCLPASPMHPPAKKQH